MYNAALLLHSWLRWVVLLAGLALVIRSAMGMGNQARWGSADDRNVRLFVISLDLQLLVGLLLYFVLSPVVKVAMSDVASAMRNADTRFWLVEHLTGMVVAIALAHVGSVKIRRAVDAASKRQMTVIFMGIARGRDPAVDPLARHAERAPALPVLSPCAARGHSAGPSDPPYLLAYVGRVRRTRRLAHVTWPLGTWSASAGPGVTP